MMEVMVTYMQSFSQTVTTNKPTPSFGLSAVVTKNSLVKQKPRERECVDCVGVQLCQATGYVQDSCNESVLDCLAGPR